MKYQIYGFLHKNVKKVLKRLVETNNYRMVSVSENNIDKLSGRLIISDSLSTFLNDIPSPLTEDILMKDVYPVENICECGKLVEYKDSFVKKCKCDESELGVPFEDAPRTWMEFVEHSVIPKGYRNEGLSYAGYIYEYQEWCLPSWVWTSAAIVRMYFSKGMITRAISITDKLLQLQLDCGGWIVRYDYDGVGVVPILAPNDSAYIANNACLRSYRSTKNMKYLDAAKRCADWIINTSRSDGMVYIGYNMKRKCWDKSHNIVDVGFTASLFSELYDITKEEKYISFIHKFVDSYIALYYNTEKKGFATGIDKDDNQIGGMFGRGQAWALEGLIPAYRVLKEKSIKKVIDDTVDTLLRCQKDGGWPYNISRTLMGIDCKATSVIAYSLMRWIDFSVKPEAIIKSASDAYEWCIRHTSNEKEAKGGIFSYTVEGAVVHHLYSSTAFVYGSSYAIELKQEIDNYYE